MRIPVILRDSALAVALGVASGSAFAASSRDPAQPPQQESFWAPSVEPVPDVGMSSTGPYDGEDHFVDSRGFPLEGFREIENPPS